MPLNPVALATQLEAAELAASGGVIPPEAAAKIKAKSEAQAAAIHAFILAGDVNTSVNTAVAPGQLVAGSAGPAPVVASTTTIGTGTGTGVGKIT